MKKQFEVSHSLRVRPGGTASFLSLSILLLVACAAFVPCASVVAAENGRVQAAPVGDERPVDRRRWWLDIWAHSMQETCFITWMDTQFGGHGWQWMLPVQQVNSIYVWWIVAVWEQPNGK